MKVLSSRVSFPPASSQLFSSREVGREQSSDGVGPSQQGGGEGFGWRTLPRACAGILKVRETSASGEEPRRGGLEVLRGEKRKHRLEISVSVVPSFSLLLKLNLSFLMLCFLTLMYGMQNLSSPNKDRIHTACIGMRV